MIEKLQRLSSTVCRKRFGASFLSTQSTTEPLHCKGSVVFSFFRRNRESYHVFQISFKRLSGSLSAGRQFPVCGLYRDVHRCWPLSECRCVPATPAHLSGFSRYSAADLRSYAEARENEYAAVHCAQAPFYSIMAGHSYRKNTPYRRGSWAAQTRGPAPGGNKK